MKILKKSLILSASLLTLSLVTALKASNYTPESANVKDWRKTGTPEEQLDMLVKITPGTHHWMTEIAYRYQSLYWSVQQEKWEFANYQVDGIDKMTKRAARARVKRAKSMDEFRNSGVFEEIKKTITNKDKNEFKKSFEKMGGECMACHAKEGFSFITVPLVPPQPNSIVLGYPE